MDQKIEFHLKDAIGRSWQCGTIQLDFSMPDRLNSYYIDDCSKKQNPIMIHRAILGSLERFIGILIEHYEGEMPIWLSPIQIVLIAISIDQEDYVKRIYNTLTMLGVRATIDVRNKNLSFKIREHSVDKVPLMGIIGKEEQNLEKISLRKKDGSIFGKFSVDELGRFILNQKVDI